jgi:Tfp pilus assembly protein PilF
VNQDVTGAEAKAAETIQLAPNWYKPHLLRAQILQASGRNEEAAREYKVSLTLGWKGK